MPGNPTSVQSWGTCAKRRARAPPRALLGWTPLCWEPENSASPSPKPHRPRGGSATPSHLGACPSRVQGSLSPRSSQGALFHCPGVAPSVDSTPQPPRKASVGSEGGLVCPSEGWTQRQPLEAQREGGKGQNDCTGAGWQQGWEDTVPRAKYRHLSQSHQRL